MKDKLDRNGFALVGVRRDDKGTELLSYSSVLVNEMVLLVNIIHSPTAVNL